MGITVGMKGVAETLCEREDTAKEVGSGDLLVYATPCMPQRGTGRMDIRFSPNDYYGGLHCGETLDVKINGRWVSTRIEMGNDWYLVGVDTDDLVGLIVRI